MARRYLVLGSLARAVLAGAAVSVRGRRPRVRNFDVRSFDQLLALPRGTHMLVPTIYVDAAAVTLTSYWFTFTVYAK